MLDILLVDDSQSKITHLRQALAYYRDRIKVQEASDIISAKRALLAQQFDLLVLDIQLPLRQGEEPQKSAGMNLLRELHTRDQYKKPVCIVGLTEFPESLASGEGMFRDKLWSIILFDQKTDDWAERLRGKVDYLLQTKECAGLSGPFVYDLGILTALSSPEYDSVMRLATWTEHPVTGDGSRYMTTEFSSNSKKLKVVATCAPQMGMPAAAVAATKLISNFHPRYLAMVGITGGVKGEVELGDILVADPCWDWGSGKRRSAGEGYFLDPEPMQERLDPHLKALFFDVKRDEAMLAEVKAAWSGEKPGSDLRLHLGPCASGSCVVADGVTVDEIRKHSRKLIGVEMEAYAVMHAAANAVAPRPYAFSMKSVCDFGDSEKSDKSQGYAAFVSATLLRTIAVKYFTPASAA